MSDLVFLADRWVRHGYVRELRAATYPYLERVTVSSIMCVDLLGFGDGASLVEELAQPWVFYCVLAKCLDRSQNDNVNGLNLHPHQDAEKGK